MDIDRDLSYIDNRQWIESVAVSLLAATFDYILKSSYQQTQLLKLLIKFNVSEYLPISLDSIEKTLNMLNSISKNKCNIRPSFTDLFWQETRTTSIQNYIDELINKKFYKVAFEIGCIEGITFDHVILQKWEDEFEKKHQHDDFWSCSLKEFANVRQKDKVLKALEKCCAKVESQTEKYKILKVALEWAKSNNLGNISDIEKKMWITVLHLKNYDFQFPFFSESQSFLYSHIQQELSNISIPEDELLTLTQADKNYIDTIIESLLNSVRFTEVLKLSKMFGHKHEDLTILTLCVQLAEGLLLPSQLNVEQRLLVNKAAHLRKFSQRGTGSYKSFQLSNIGTGWFSSTMNMEDFEIPGNDTVKILEILSERVKYGFDLAQKVFLTFRISVNIDRRYQQVLECKQPIELLKASLKEDCRNKLQVIHDFIVVWKWSKEKVADFVCEEVITAIDTFTKAKIEGTVLWDLDLDRDFPLILQFLPENTSSTLGAKLYSYASALYKAQNIDGGEFKISEFQMIIELLIRSHDCFTADCNMEGISVILRKSKKIISMLLEIKSWKLIVRLLTGVGRYTEMSYIFQILKENDHFEFLLRKGNRKDNGLKIALLEYLKKYCPENRELYRMVALHFTLYSEIAQIWEEEAQSLIKNLIAISRLEMQNNGLNPDNEMFVLLSNSDGTKITLNKAMQNYIHAAEYHLQGEKLMKAMQSAKQAELVALQLSILKGLGTNASCNCLLNLNNSQIGTLITLHLRGV
ncbi:spatacsin [Agrilus planipennis]|uniref:Spatacsin n=1 Tax=Agrilus planipennis TaxID=224129 RepID=A0A1W4WJF6_AGRPL|nr:spatacsin [Agrilus planipennis]